MPLFDIVYITVFLLLLLLFCPSELTSALCLVNKCAVFTLQRSRMVYSFFPQTFPKNCYAINRFVSVHLASADKKRNLPVKVESIWRTTYQIQSAIWLQISVKYVLHIELIYNKWNNYSTLYRRKAPNTAIYGKKNPSKIGHPKRP